MTKSILKKSRQGIYKKNSASKFFIYFMIQPHMEAKVISLHLHSVQFSFEENCQIDVGSYHIIDFVAYLRCCI